MTHWLWRPGPARVVRGALLPSAGLFRLGTTLRARAYARGWLAVRRLPRPAVAVGNLSVGGAGKTPVAQWIAAWYAARGHRTGILLRDYGGDEAAVHRRNLPEAIVVADRDRHRGGHRAAALGADVLVLDDAFQRLDIERDLNIVLLNADHARAVPWPLPAGPWREPWEALGRADLVIVTRKTAGTGAVRRVLRRVRAVAGGTLPVAVAHLRLTGLTPLGGGAHVGLDRLRGRRVVAAAGIADPAAFAAQLAAQGAEVTLRRYPDHHRYGAADVRRLFHAARSGDYVVVTAKDAVKLQTRWPLGGPQPLVAEQGIVWERGRQAVSAALRGAITRSAARGGTSARRRHTS